MTTTMSIRDLTRSGEKISDYDYVEVINKKTKTYNGIFIPSKYAKEIKEILDKKISQEKLKKINELNSFAGMLSGKIGEDKVSDIKRKYAK